MSFERSTGVLCVWYRRGGALLLRSLLMGDRCGVNCDDDGAIYMLRPYPSIVIRCMHVYVLAIASLSKISVSVTVPR
jgi:hypothetical protein